MPSRGGRGEKSGGGQAVDVAAEDGEASLMALFRCGLSG
jgi:hypothetical protein